MNNKKQYEVQYENDKGMVDYSDMKKQKKTYFGSYSRTDIKHAYFGF